MKMLNVGLMHRNMVHIVVWRYSVVSDGALPLYFNK